MSSGVAFFMVLKAPHGAAMEIFRRVNAAATELQPHVPMPTIMGMPLDADFREPDKVGIYTIGKHLDDARHGMALSKLATGMPEIMAREIPAQYGLVLSQDLSKRWKRERAQLLSDISVSRGP